jgi:hypothetical protein
MLTFDRQNFDAPGIEFRPMDATDLSAKSLLWLHK